MPSINLDLDFFDHPKTVRLVGLLGRGADLLPIRLWCYCGKYHAENGQMTGYSPEEIEAAAKWWGRPGQAVEALEKTGFLERCEQGFKVHDWAAANGHIAAFKERAGKAAKARWDKIRSLRDAQASNKHTPSNPLQEVGKVGDVPSGLPGGSAEGGVRRIGDPLFDSSAPTAGALVDGGSPLVKAIVDAYPKTREVDGKTSSIRITLTDYDRVAIFLNRNPAYPLLEAVKLLARATKAPPDLANFLAEPWTMDSLEAATKGKPKAPQAKANPADFYTSFQPEDTPL